MRPDARHHFGGRGGGGGGCTTLPQCVPGILLRYYSSKVCYCWRFKSRCLNRGFITGKVSWIRSLACTTLLLIASLVTAVTFSPSQAGTVLPSRCDTTWNGIALKKKQSEYSFRLYPYNVRVYWHLSKLPSTTGMRNDFRDVFPCLFPAVVISCPRSVLTYSSFMALWCLVCCRSFWRCEPSSLATKTNQDTGGYFLHC